MAHIFAHLIATRVRFDTDPTTGVTDDVEEQHGWIDPRWSMYVLHDSRNDATPLISEDADSEELTDYVRDVLGDLGAFEDNGDGTFYSADSVEHDGWEYTYAVHFTIKFFGPNGWTEQPWHPVNDGKIEL